MKWIVANIKGIMIVSGALTFTMVYAAIAPQAALQSNFGAVLEGPVADVVVRNWGALIGLVGAMLVAGAFDPGSRTLALVVAGVSKLVFISLVLAHGRQFLGNQAGMAIAIDAVWVAVFAAYLVGARVGRPRPARERIEGK
jgi:hypothetical protein